jgi:hypothetical protein
MKLLSKHDRDYATSNGLRLRLKVYLCRINAVSYGDKNAAQNTLHSF